MKPTLPTLSDVITGVDAYPIKHVGNNDGELEIEEFDDQSEAFILDIERH